MGNLNFLPHNTERRKKQHMKLASRLLGKNRNGKGTEQTAED